MKPKNFPGRKNQRRINAVLSGNLSKRAEEKTKAKILDQDYAESIRTKKKRS